MRVRYWRDAVHEAVVEMDLLPTLRADFHSSIELCALANIVPHQAQGSPQKISRNSSEIARGRKNAYYLISQSRKPWRSSQAGQDHAVMPGESVLIDSRIPYAFTFPEGLEDLSVELSVDWVERWIPDPMQVVGRPLPASAGWGLALRGVKEALVPRELVALSLPDELIEDQLGVLLALASPSSFALPRADQALYERCLSAVRCRMCKPGLVASEIARECAVSLRTLHRTFASHGRTFAGVLMEQRVDAAARMLADPRFRHLTIAEVARRCGFLDPSHFARQFRRLRKVGPREFRARAS
jgi:AraC-like DNA-binding protein